MPYKKPSQFDPARKKRSPSKIILKTWERELSGCKETIKHKLNREVKYLAYPYGDTNSLVIEVAKKLEYRGAFTIKRGGNPFFMHPYRVNRSEVYGDFTLSQFEKNLDDFPGADPQVKNRFFKRDISALFIFGLSSSFRDAPLRRKTATLTLRRINAGTPSPLCTRGKRDRERSFLRFAGTIPLESPRE